MEQYQYITKPTGPALWDTLTLVIIYILQRVSVLFVLLSKKMVFHMSFVSSIAPEDANAQKLNGALNECALSTSTIYADV